MTHSSLLTLVLVAAAQPAFSGEWVCWVAPTDEGRVVVSEGSTLLPVLAEHTEGGQWCGLHEIAPGRHFLELAVGLGTGITVRTEQSVYVPAPDSPLRADLAGDGVVGGAQDLAAYNAASRHGAFASKRYTRVELRTLYSCALDTTKCAPWGWPAVSCWDWGVCPAWMPGCACETLATQAERDSAGGALP